MLKKTLIILALPLVSLLAISVATPLWGGSAPSASQTAPSAVATAPTGTLQKMIVESGSVTIDLDLNGFNGNSSLVARPATLQFAVGANSFFPILVFNNLLRGPEQGSMTLVPAGVNASGYSLPAALGASLQQLVIEKLPSDRGFDLAVRDGNTGFTFFNVEGHHYDYDANARALSITKGRLLVSKEFADALGRPSDAGSIVGQISVGAAMQPVEIDQLVNGEPQSAVMPGVGTVPGPDVIVGDLIGLEQSQSGSVGGRVGLALGTDACNKGVQNAAWIALPSNNHPFIPQNLYRMSGGANNNDRFEQIGKSWGKHAFLALENDACSFGCNTSGCTTGSHLCPGCSDPYSASLNYGQTGIGSRAWVNPFTGVFPSTANSHTGHNHTGTSHRVTVASSDLNPAQNAGATYFAEGQYITPHEYTWCQQHPGQCNMYNNASYRQFSVTGTTDFTFSPVGATFRMKPATDAWAGATSVLVEPEPGIDGRAFVVYRVTNPSAGVWHYEYA